MLADGHTSEQRFKTYIYNICVELSDISAHNEPTKF